MKLLLDDLEDFHGACFDADAAGDALGSGALRRLDHNLHGADLHALTAGGAQLLIDHVHTGLGILGDRASLANLGALTALNAGHRLGASAFGNDLNAAQVRIKCLKEGCGASTDALQTCHTFRSLLNC